MKTTAGFNVSALLGVPLLLAACVGVATFAMPHAARAQYSCSPHCAIAKPPNNLGLVGYWSFNEGTGTRAGDFSGNSRHGTIENSPAWVNGKRNKALDFDAVEDRVSVPDDNGLDITGSLTIALWVYVEGIPSTRVPWVGKRDDAAGPMTYNFELSSNDCGTNTPHLWWTSESSTHFNGFRANASSTLNTWEHWVAVRDNDGEEVKFYRNGIEVGTTVCFTNGTFSADTTTASLTFARASFDSFGTADGFEVLDGKEEEIRLYNRALSASEVAYLYNSGAVKINASSADLDNGSSLANGLIGHWTFDGGDTTWTSNSAGTTRDRSGNNSTGTLTDMSQQGSPTAGKLGQALAFDGVDDIIEMPGSGSVAENISNMTIALWAKTSASQSGMVISKQTNSAAPGWAISAENGGGAGRYAVFLNDSDGTHGIFKYTDPLYSDGVWHHIVAVVTTSGDVTVYIDAAPVTLSDSSTPPIDDYNSSGAIIRIGAASNGVPFAGSVDDVRIYNRTLSSAEVQQLYKLGSVRIIQ